MTGVSEGGEDNGSGGGNIGDSPPLTPLEVDVLLVVFMYLLYLDDKVVGSGGNGGGTGCCCVGCF